LGVAVLPTPGYGFPLPNKKNTSIVTATARKTVFNPDTTDEAIKVLGPYFLAAKIATIDTTISVIEIASNISIAGIIVRAVIAPAKDEDAKLAPSINRATPKRA
jgi:hypothetical protein